MKHVSDNVRNKVRRWKKITCRRYSHFGKDHGECPIEMERWMKQIFWYKFSISSKTYLSKATTWSLQNLGLSTVDGKTHQIRSIPCCCSIDKKAFCNAKTLKLIFKRWSQNLWELMKWRCEKYCYWYWFPSKFIYFRFQRSRDKLCLQVSQITL